MDCVHLSLKAKQACFVAGFQKRIIADVSVLFGTCRNVNRPFWSQTGHGGNNFAGGATIDVQE
jgi:hypothetical protein